MARFYQSNVRDQSGEILANALGQAFQQYQQGKRMKQQDALADEDRQRSTAMQDFTLAQQHMRLTKPGEVAHELSRVGMTQAPSPVSVDWGQQAATGVQPTAQVQSPVAMPSEIRTGNGWVQDYGALRNERQQDAKAALESKLAEVLATERTKLNADPEGRQVRLDYQRAQTNALNTPKPVAPTRLSTVTLDDGVYAMNPVTGDTVRRLGNRPRPQSGGGTVETRETPTVAQQFTRTNQLRDDYQKNPSVQQGYGIAKAISGLQAALGGSGGLDDLAIIYETVKLFDPGSVVKEGEISLTRSANSLPGQVGLLVQSWNSGKKLTPQMRAQIQGLMDRKLAEAEGMVTPVQSEFGGMARRYGVQGDSSHIAPSPFNGLRRGAPVTRPNDPTIGGILTPAESATTNPYRRNR